MSGYVFFVLVGFLFYEVMIVKILIFIILLCLKKEKEYDLVLIKFFLLLSGWGIFIFI